MFRGIIDWINNLGNQLVEYILYPLLHLPGLLKFLLVIAIAFLTIIGLIRVARKMLKLVIGVAGAFIILLILWLIFFR